MLILTVESPPGHPSFTAMKDACELATRLAVVVRVIILGHECLLYPGDNPHIRYKQECDNTWASMTPMERVTYLETLSGHRMSDVVYEAAADAQKLREDTH